ncbi:MAG: VanW family protein [Clostridia bacterium]|nr:VanW family protein [Clostridia bacterium]
MDEFRRYEKNKKLNKTKKVLLVILIAIVAIIVIFSTAFAIYAMTNDRLIMGTSINGFDVSGLTKEDAKAKVQEKLDRCLQNNIILKCEDFEITINPTQIEATFDVETAVQEAYKIGRSGNLITDNYTIFNALTLSVDTAAKLKYNEEALDKLVEDISNKLPNPVVQPTYYMEDNTIVITRGKEGNVAKKGELKQTIIYAIDRMFEVETVLDIPYEVKQPEALASIEDIHSSIYKEAKDAYFTMAPYVVYPHTDGLDFAISIDEARNIISDETKTEYTIPLAIITPEITTDRIGDDAFPDLLSTFSTTFAASNKNRTTNIKLAAGKINDVIIMPGEEFSYNKVVGERTIAAGYKEAGVFVNGKVEDGLGGGICQVSSTLYNTALMANMEITSRTNHGYLTSYLKGGLDATVVYGAIDFKFKNSRNYPVKIKTIINGGKLTVEMYGLKMSNEPEIKIDSEVTKIKNGYRATTYKIQYQDGQEISREVITKDSYGILK